jgi:hypothetical protein
VFGQAQIEDMIKSYESLMGQPAPWMRMGKEGPAVQVVAFPVGTQGGTNLIHRIRRRLHQ